MARDIDPALLRSFMAIVDTGSMTAAGRVVNLTQAAVSQQVKRLEELFDAALFDRNSKQIRLTTAGEDLLGQARRMLALNDEIYSRMTARGTERDVRLGVPCDLIGPFMPSILRSFREINPCVRIGLISATSRRLRGMFENNGLDLYLSTDVAPAAGDNCLRREPLVWVGARGGAAWRERPLPLSIGDETCAFRSVALPALKERQIDYRLVCEVEEDIVAAIVEADMAVSARMLSCVPPSVDRLGPRCGLPTLPDFHINLQPPAAGAPAWAEECAQHLRHQFALRFPSDKQAGLAQSA